jgi:hypothetical protein
MKPSFRRGGGEKTALNKCERAVISGCREQRVHFRGIARFEIPGRTT